MIAEILRADGVGDPGTPNNNALAIFAKVVSGVAHLHCKTSDGTVFRLSPAVQTITGATTQQQVDSIVAALVALGLVTDGR
jgi:hypothetical protein